MLSDDSYTRLLNHRHQERIEWHAQPRFEKQFRSRSLERGQNRNGVASHRNSLKAPDRVFEALGQPARYPALRQHRVSHADASPKLERTTPTENLEEDSSLYSGHRGKDAFQPTVGTGALHFRNRMSDLAGRACRAGGRGGGCHDDGDADRDDGGSKDLHGHILVHALGFLNGGRIAGRKRGLFRIAGRKSRRTHQH